MDVDETGFKLKHFLDFFCAVSRTMGLGGLLPPEDSQNTFGWSFEFDFRQAFRAFFSKHGMLRYNPSNAMIHIGTTRYGLHAWMMFVSESDLESGVPDAKAGRTWAGATTQVSRRHLRMFLMFFIYAAVKSGYTGVACSPNQFYAVDLEKEDAVWSFCQFKHVLFYLLM